MVGTSSLSCDHVKHPIPAQPKQMALIHNCLAAGQVGLEPINLIELIRYVGRLPLGGEDVKDVQDVQDVQGGSPRGWATLVVFATCLPACCHLLTFHYIYFTGHNCKVDEWICRLMSPRGWVPAISTTINQPPTSNWRIYLLVRVLICSQTNLFYNWIWNWRWHSVSDCLACGAISMATGHAPPSPLQQSLADLTSAVYVFRFW